jgi:hypothetical protein
LETESEDKILSIKREAQRGIQEVTERMNLSIEKQKEITRLQRTSESEFDKQKALF